MYGPARAHSRVVFAGQIQLGPSLMVGSISATAVYVESLPSPPQLMVDRPVPSSNAGGDDDRMVLALAKTVEQMAAVNRQRLQVLLSIPDLFFTPGSND